MTSCTFANCTSTQGGARGLCQTHYQRWRRYSDPAISKAPRGSTFDRFSRYASFGSGCWEWRGARNARGYGVMGRGGRSGGNVLTHRYFYEIAVGPIPEGMCVLHTCDNPPCFRPDHLWIGSRDDNNKDMVAKGRHWSQRWKAPAT